MKFWPRKKQDRSRPTYEACEAIRQADRAFVDAERLDDAAQDVEQRLRATTARNHFREAVEQAMARRRPS